MTITRAPALPSGILIMIFKTERPQLTKGRPRLLPLIHSKTKNKTKMNLARHAVVTFSVQYLFVFVFLVWFFFFLGVMG